ncbi:MAG TPA: alcohol dehydrogenase catalytic domain-containing protein [Candidatus Acidoferrales bacterium]|nr:alcohol dehydrogenase catalytic domain-containing protein [Candidatus Acidoferrales bacterium]
MATMKAIQVRQGGADFELVQKEVPEPRAGEVLIKVEACGICAGDSLAKDGGGPFPVKYPVTPGHEVVGKVARIGAGETVWKLGQRVGVGWHGGHCMQCLACRSGQIADCPNSLITGLTINGGYAEYMLARAEAVIAMPDEFGAAEAAPLLCAGVTTFGALQRSGAKGGDTVAVHGIGGLGHLAIQFSKKLGFRTVALSRGRDKEALSYQMGAHAYVDTSEGKAAAELQKMGGANSIICTAPNSAEIAGLVGGLARGGNLVMVAAPHEPLTIPAFLLLGGSRSITGWVGGSQSDTLRFSVRAGIKPMIEEFPLERAAEAYGRMKDAKVRFRSVLKM